MENEVTPSPLSEDEALEHQDVKKAIQYCEETAAYGAVRLNDVYEQMMLQMESHLYILLNRLPVQDPDGLARVICNLAFEKFNQAAPSASTLNGIVIRALRGHIDNVSNPKLRLDVNGKIVRRDNDR